MASLTFQNFIFFQTQYSSNIVFTFRKSLNVWKDICLEVKHVGAHLNGPIEKEMCHLKAEKNKSFWMFTERQILFHCFVCLCICIFFLFYYPTFSLLCTCMFESYNDNLFCGWTSSCFFIRQNIILVSFAIRNKAVLTTLMQIYLVIYSSSKNPVTQSRKN